MENGKFVAETKTEPFHAWLNSAAQKPAKKYLDEYVKTTAPKVCILVRRTPTDDTYEFRFQKNYKRVTLRGYVIDGIFEPKTKIEQYNAWLAEQSVSKAKPKNVPDPRLSEQEIILKEGLKDVIKALNPTLKTGRAGGWFLLGARKDYWNKARDLIKEKFPEFKVAAIVIHKTFVELAIQKGPQEFIGSWLGSLDFHFKSPYNEIEEKISF
jgi:hypothetical protein